MVGVKTKPMNKPLNLNTPTKNQNNKTPWQEVFIPFNNELPLIVLQHVTFMGYQWANIDQLDRTSIVNLSMHRGKGLLTLKKLF